MSTALFVDTFTRDVEVSTVSVTEVPEKGLVLRFGAKIGNLWQLTANEGGFFRNDLPIIVATRGYRAYSSDGHVEVIANYRGERTRERRLVVGMQGFPWSKGLRPRANPMEVLVLRAGTNIRRLETHAGRGTGAYPAWHSNVATAGAAAKAIELMAELRPNSVFVMEGQSDYEQAWELAAQWDRYETKPETKFDWPEEHRGDLFTDEAFVVAALRRQAGQKAETPEAARGRYFTYLNLLMADGDYWSDGGRWVDQLLPDSIRQMVSDRLDEIVQALANSMRKEGWRLGIDTSVANHFLQAMSPKGEVVVSGWGAVHGPKEYESRLIKLADGLTEDERAELFKLLEQEDEQSRRWVAKVGA